MVGHTKSSDLSVLNELDYKSFFCRSNLTKTWPQELCLLSRFFALKIDVLRTSEQMHSLNDVQEGTLNKIDKLY
jgi:hypothetical protein